MGDSGVAERDMAGPSKVESVDMAEGTPSSVESTPEQEALPNASQDQPAPPVKRKGGRKPIYATSEERKQRNRQAQAAFRERRTEYIKQLEATIQQNEESLANLQQSHRAAADECLMLRYKNSLLERILLEKGIDVQAELQIKTGSPILGHGFLPPGAGMPSAPTGNAPLQRTAVQRQHARRSIGQAFLPKLAPGQSNPDLRFPQASPSGHPTPSSHASSNSPTNVPVRSPLTMHQGGMTPPASSVLAQGQAQQYQAYQHSSQQQPNAGYYAPQPQQQLPNIQPPPQRPPPPSHYQSDPSVVSSHSNHSQHSLGPPLSAGAPPSAAPSSASAYYPSPFQKHIDQLEQEYDTQHSRALLEQPDHHEDAEPTSDPSPQAQFPQYGQQQAQAMPSSYTDYGPQYRGQPIQQQQQYSEQYGGQQLAPTSQPQVPQASGAGFAMGQVIDPNDPMLDADPFGLSASMHYPTSYSEQQPPAR